MSDKVSSVEAKSSCDVTSCEVPSTTLLVGDTHSLTEDQLDSVVHTIEPSSLLAQLQEISTSLQLNKTPWQDRVAALQALRALCTSPAFTSLDVDQVETLLRHSLCMQLRDLRSQVVRETCETLGALSKCTMFPKLSHCFIGALLDNTSKTVSAISTCSSNLLRTICALPLSTEGVSSILSRASDKHPMIRRRAYESLFLFVHIAPHDTTVSYLNPMVKQLANGISDPSPEVRISSRLTCYALQKAFSEDWIRKSEPFISPAATEHINEMRSQYDAIDDKTSSIEYSSTSACTSNSLKHSVDVLVKRSPFSPVRAIKKRQMGTPRTPQLAKKRRLPFDSMPGNGDTSTVLEMPQT
jgi:hypothetical protein